VNRNEASSSGHAGRGLDAGGRITAAFRIAVMAVACLWLAGCTAMIVTGAVVGTAAAAAGAVVSTGVGAVAGAVKGAASVFSDDDE
jgi:hypothetical protein